MQSSDVKEFEETVGECGDKAGADWVSKPALASKNF